MSDELTDLEHEQYATLAQLGSETLNESVLKNLKNKHGVRYVHFWVKWLPHKVAYEYERGRPVANPSGLLIRAIEGQWEVDPNWPEFDASAHTWKAREEFERKEARKANHKPQDDLDAEFDAQFGPNAKAEPVAVDDDSFPF